MDDYTRKFNAAEDKDQQVHYILTTVYESLKEKGYDHQPDRGLHPVGGPHLHHQPQLRPHADLQDRSGRAAAGAGQELSGAVKQPEKCRALRPRGIFFAFLPISAQLSEFFLPVRVDSRSQMCYNLVTKIATEVFPWQK